MVGRREGPRGGWCGYMGREGGAVQAQIAGRSLQRSWLSLLPRRLIVAVGHRASRSDWHGDAGARARQREAAPLRNLLAAILAMFEALACRQPRARAEHRVLRRCRRSAPARRRRAPIRRPWRSSFSSWPNEIGRATVGFQPEPAAGRGVQQRTTAREDAMFSKLIALLGTVSLAAGASAAAAQSAAPLSLAHSAAGPRRRRAFGVQRDKGRCQMDPRRDRARADHLGRDRAARQ